MKLFSLLVWLLSATVFGQSSSSPQSNAQATALPIMTQLKRSVIFIQTDCAHVPTNAEDKTRIDPWIGTGFLVAYPDDRVGSDGAFYYLVTNRHIAVPGIEHNAPCSVVNYTLRVNLREVDATSPSHSEAISLGPNGGWSFPDDKSVDLAITTISIDPKLYDFKTLSINMFATKKVIKEQAVVEGDHIFFAGLFIQYLPYLNQTLLEPIVREGSVALLPTEDIPTALNDQPGSVYLGEAHAFGGNSGSPVFVNVGGIREHSTGGLDYRLLGVLSAEVYETADLHLETTTVQKGTINANSGLSIIVPAEQILNLLNTASMQHQRDEVVKSLQH